METHNVHPRNVVETPLTDRGHYVLLNLVKYYSRYIYEQNKDVIFFDTLKDSLPLDENLRKNYLDVSLADKVDFYKLLSYFCKNLDTLIKNEKVNDWVWDLDESSLPFQPE